MWENLFRRERKFRGKPATDHLRGLEEVQEFMQDGWLYGYLIGTDVIVGKLADIDSNTIYPEFWCRVDPSTVGQYTGLKDKNGKEIYEGDVLGAFCDTQRFEVKYCLDRGGYFLDDVVLCTGAEPASECLGNLLDTVEVIGNAFENPDLLGGEPHG